MQFGWAMAAYGLYTHIQSNKRRSIALLIGLFVLVYVLVFAGALLAKRCRTMRRSTSSSAPPTTIFSRPRPSRPSAAIVWIVDRLLLSPVDDRRRHRRARRDPRRRSRALYNLLENLCISRGITMPKLRIADDDALNAFATGLNQKQYSITVTSGLMEALNDAESKPCSATSSRTSATATCACW